MGYNKVTIDVEARFVDNMTAQAKKAGKTLDGIDKKKAKATIDADTSKLDKKIKQIDDKIGKLGKSKTEIKLSAIDNASKILQKVLGEAKRFANKVYSAVVKVRDSNVLSTINKLGARLQSFAGKAWTTAIKIKDYATAPLTKIKNMLFSIKTLAAAITMGFAANKFAIQPTQMFADREDLVAQFKVLLGSAEAAENRISELTTFAGQTPFTRDEIFQASRVLQTYTEGALATPDAEGGLRMIGDIAAATGQEYTQVASYMGRLYNEVKRGGETLGEPLAFLREMGALSAEQESKIKEIATGSGTIEQKWAAIAGQFSKTDGMMMEMSNQMNNLMLGVSSFLKNNVWMKLGEGISKSLKPFLMDFRTWRSENKELIADMAAWISDFAALWSGKVLGGVRKFGSLISDVITSEDFKTASITDKFKMLWEGVIKDPLTSWWEESGREKVADTLNKIGAFIGKGLTTVLLAVFGATNVLDGGIGEDAGANIAGSFLQGFLDNFDGAAISQAFVDAIGNVWGALPAWAKMLLGTVGAGKLAGGVQNVAGKLADMKNLWTGEGESLFSDLGGLKGMLGSAGAAAGEGTGLIGLLSKLGGKIGGTAVATGAGAAALGAGAVGGTAGALYGGFTLGHGVHDIYQGYRAEDNTQLGKGIMRTGGVLNGAGLGAAIGTMVLPGIGTLIGAGLGAGAGALAGNFGAKKLQEMEDAKKSVAEITKESLKSAEAADELAKRQEHAAKVIEDSFGDVKLSMEEIQTVAKNIAQGDSAGAFETFSNAAASADKAVASLASSAESLNKWNWKASIGFKFDETDQESYKAAVEEYISNAEQVVEAQHYEFKAAIDLLIDPESDSNKSITEGMNGFYEKLQGDLNANSKELRTQVALALDDGVIDQSEAEIIAELQSKISEITQKVAKAETEAKMDAIKIKFGSGELDYSSFQSLQAEIQSQIESSTATYDQALETTIAGLRLRLEEDPEFDQADFDAAVQSAAAEYEANIDEIKANAANVQLEILGDAFSDILGEDAMAQLQSALETSINDGIQPIEWTSEQAANYLNVSSLTDQAFAVIPQMLQSVADTLPPTDMQMQVNPDYQLAEGSEGKLEEVLKPTEALTFPALATVNPTFETSEKFDGSAEDFGVQSSYSFPTSSDILASYSANKFPGDKATFGIKDSYNFSTSAHVTVNWSYTDVGKKSINQARGGLVGPNGPRGFSAGGMVRGGAQLITVAEEGSPEMIIPMSSQRRGRALKLWAQAGHMLGVPGFARGGMTDGQDEGVRYQQYSTDSSSGSQGVQVDVGGVSIDIHVDGEQPASIVEEIKAQSSEIVDTIAGILADAFEGQFANTPSKGGAY